MRSFDAARAISDAREMSFPRLVGTPDEIRVRELVVDKLKQIGLQVKQFPFQFYPAMPFGILRHVLLIGAVLLTIHRILLSLTPRWGAVLGLALPLVARVLWNQYRTAAARKLEDLTAEHPIQARLIPHAHTVLRSANIVADLPVDGEVNKRLVLSAHTDSKSQNMSIVTRAVCAIYFALGVFILPVLTLPGAIWPGWLTGTSGVVWWVLFALALLGALILLTLQVGNESPGAVDNAGSCALLLETARALSENPPQGVAVRVLLTGAEEMGLAGGYAYAQDAIKDPDWREAVHLNFEAVGLGNKLFITSESGPTGSHARTAQAATELTQTACRGVGVKPRKLGKLIGGEADHIPLVEAGLSAVTLMFTGAGGTVVHTKNDKPELVREDSMALAGKIVLAAVAHLEEKKKAT